MLRTIQKGRILKMLQPPNAPFKVLILDDSTQSILSALIKLSDLRSCGITIHFLISASRTEIKDAPAIYFLSSPSDFMEDVPRNLYQSYFLNISTSFPRSAFERLAQELSERQIAQKVISIADQFINFTAIEEDFFTLNLRNSYLLREEADMLRATISGLFSIFVSLNELPFIIGDHGELGRMLYQKINNMKIIKPSVKKPLIIILNRDFDLITPSSHVMGYIELVHDVLGIKNNQIEVVEGDKKVFYDLDTDIDFYKCNRFLDFPVVADLVEKELHTYKKEMALRSITDKSDKAAVQKALDSVPYLQKKNELINTHLNISMKVLDEIKKRKLDDFYKMEQVFDRDEIMELSEKAEKNDIERLCIMLLNSKNSDLIGPLLEKAGIEEGVVKYISNKLPSETGFRERFKNLIFRKSSPLCGQVEEVLSSIKRQAFDKLECLDPGAGGLFFSEISKVIVYVHGGVTYTELKAIKEVEKSYKLPIILGGSEIMNADEFLSQVREFIKKE